MLCDSPWPASATQNLRRCSHATRSRESARLIRWGICGSPSVDSTHKLYRSVVSWWPARYSIYWPWPRTMVHLPPLLAIPIVYRRRMVWRGMGGFAIASAAAGGGSRALGRWRTRGGSLILSCGRGRRCVFLRCRCHGAPATTESASCDGCDSRVTMGCRRRWYMRPRPLRIEDQTPHGGQGCRRWLSGWRVGVVGAATCTQRADRLEVTDTRPTGPTHEAFSNPRKSERRLFLENAGHR